MTKRTEPSSRDRALAIIAQAERSGFPITHAQLWSRLGFQSRGAVYNLVADLRKKRRVRADYSGHGAVTLRIVG